jgi:hypothetical protein
MKRLRGLFIICLVVSLSMGFFVHVKHAVFWWEEVPVFYALYGFFGCVLIVIASKWLGHYVLQRPEDYYEHD